MSNIQLPATKEYLACLHELSRMKQEFAEYVSSELPTYNTNRLPKQEYKEVEDKPPMYTTKLINQFQSQHSLEEQLEKLQLDNEKLKKQLDILQGISDKLKSDYTDIQYKFECKVSEYNELHHKCTKTKFNLDAEKKIRIRLETVVTKLLKELE